MSEERVFRAAVALVAEGFAGYSDDSGTGFLDWAVVRRRHFDELRDALDAWSGHEAVRLGRSMSEPQEAR